MASIGMPKYVGIDVTARNEKFLPALFYILDQFGTHTAFDAAWVSWFLRSKTDQDWLSKQQLGKKESKEVDEKFSEVNTLYNSSLSLYSIDEKSFLDFVRNEVLKGDLTTIKPFEKVQEQNIYYIRQIPRKNKILLSKEWPSETFAFMANIFGKIEVTASVAVIEELQSEFNRIVEDLSEEDLLQMIKKHDGISQAHANIVLHGPPGTGKTRYAKRICAYRIGLLGSPQASSINWSNEKQTEFQSRVKIVQFHPSTTYEDFVEGIKPIVATDGTIKYEIIAGSFLVMQAKADHKMYLNVPGYYDGSNFCPIPQILQLYDLTDIENIDIDPKEIRNAVIVRELPGKSLDVILQYTWFKMRSKNWNQETTNKSYVILIDEINRAKVSQAFGELLYLFADGSDMEMPLPVQTQYSRTLIQAHPALSIVATMNNTDKNVDDIDLALRRRFEFHGMFPDYSAIGKHLSEKWKVLGGDPVDWLKDLNKRLCEQTGSADLQVGQSFLFKIGSLDEGKETQKRLIRVFYQEILPTLESAIHRDSLSMRIILGMDAFLLIYQDNEKFLSSYLESDLLNRLDELDADEREKLLLPLERMKLVEIPKIKVAAAS